MNYNLSNDLPNDTQPLDPIERRWESQHRYYANMRKKKKKKYTDVEKLVPKRKQLLLNERFTNR